MATGKRDSVHHRYSEHIVETLVDDPVLDLGKGTLKATDTRITAQSRFTTKNLDPTWNIESAVAASERLNYHRNDEVP